MSNLLIHREFTNPFPVKLIIDRTSVRTENASRALFDGRLTLADFNPMPKNPIIANVFSNIGLAEELGSGMRNLAKYARPFLGADAILEEGDVFRATIPRTKNVSEAMDARSLGVPKQQTLDAIASLIERLGEITVKQAASAAGVSTRTAAKYLKAFAEHGRIESDGLQQTRTYQKKPQ